MHLSARGQHFTWLFDCQLRQALVSRAFLCYRCGAVQFVLARFAQTALTSNSPPPPSIYRSAVCCLSLQVSCLRFCSQQLRSIRQCTTKDALISLDRSVQYITLCHHSPTSIPYVSTPFLFNLIFSLFVDCRLRQTKSRICDLEFDVYMILPI